VILVAMLMEIMARDGMNCQCNPKYFHTSSLLHNVLGRQYSTDWNVKDKLENISSNND
jgi:hypothetical protein